MSITVNADATDDILSNYSYMYYCINKEGLQSIVLTNKSVSETTLNSSNAVLMNPNNQQTIKLSNSSSTDYYVSLRYDSEIYPLIFTYDGNQWIYEIAPYFVKYSELAFCFGAVISFDYWSTTKPTDFPELVINQGLTIEEVQQLVNQSINSTTSATTSANNYQQQALNNYQQYQNGTITLSTLETRLNNIVTQLNALNNSASATLADKVAINNALTQTQIINDTAIKDAIIQEMEEDLTASSNITSSIATQVSNANNTFQNFTQGSITQSVAVTQINQYITTLTNLITPQTPTADVEAINTAVNSINGIKDSITNYSELDPNVSESQISSDQEEIEMLNELVSVMQDQTIENKMQDQQIAGQSDEINSVLEPLWSNKYMTYLIGVSGVLILACIVLHTKYRML